MECSRRRRGREHEGQVRSEVSVGAKIVRGSVVLGRCCDEIVDN